MRGLLLLALLAFPVAADQVCTSIYNAMTGQWEYQCVERPDDDRRQPVCHQEYDAMNQVWVTVCN
jgi:hypothetical protein